MRAITGKEIYIGSESEVRKIQSYLAAARSSALTASAINLHLKRVKGDKSLPPLQTILLADFLNTKTEQNFNFELFSETIEVSAQYLRRLFPSFVPMKMETYVVAEAIKNGKIGGFHGDYGIGYQYISNFAFSELLNPEMIADPNIRALELARNYIHDSLHAITFRSFGIAREKAYRFQYGINFRTSDGYSYSSNNIDKECSFAINLNTLMDGIVTSLTVDAMEEVTSQIYPTSYWSHQILQDLRGNYKYISSPIIKSFSDVVMVQVEQFLAYWGGHDLKPIIGHAMIDGDLTLVQNYFEYSVEDKSSDKKLVSYLNERRLHNINIPDNIWENLFISRDFQLRQPKAFNNCSLNYFSGN